MVGYMMRLFRLGLSLLLFSLALVVQAQADQPRMSETLSVFGAVKQEKTFSLNDLKQLAGLQLQNVEVMCMSGANKGQMENLSGVALKTLLEHVGLKVDKGKDFRKLAIIAYATDDYWVTYSWGEIFNQANGDQMLVYFAKDGVELGAEDGRFALMPGNDVRKGGRQVKWLERIEVRLLAP
jgi:hypothetical protein